MLPAGCPTFNIPVPTPNEALKRQHQQEKQRQQQLQRQQAEQQQEEDNNSSNENNNKNFFEKAGNQFFSSLKRIGGFWKPSKSDDSNKLAEKRGEAEATGRQSYLPMMVAGAAAVALGGLALFGTSPSVATVAKDELIYQRKRSNEVYRSLESARKLYERK